MLDATEKRERRETIDELSDLMLIVQKMGRKLAEETHGNAYSNVRDLNELLHQTRAQCLKIQDNLTKDAQQLI